MIFAGIHNISKVRELGRLGGLGMDNGAPQRGGKVFMQTRSESHVE